MSAALRSVDVWAFQERLTRRLAAWAFVSLLSGLGMLLLRLPFWTGMAFQFLGWAAVNLGIAWIGAWAARRRKAGLSAEQVISTQPQERRKLERILWINTGLDVLYMLGGVLVAVFLAGRGPQWIGTGIGILLQGTFLFFFDWIHALTLRKSA